MGGDFSLRYQCTAGAGGRAHVAGAVHRGVDRVLAGDYAVDVRGLLREACHLRHQGRGQEGNPTMCRPLAGGGTARGSRVDDTAKRWESLPSSSHQIQIYKQEIGEIL